MPPKFSLDHSEQVHSHSKSTSEHYIEMLCCASSKAF